MGYTIMGSTVIYKSNELMNCNMSVICFNISDLQDNRLCPASAGPAKCQKKKKIEA